MPRKKTRVSAVDPTRPSLASLVVPVKLVTLEKDAELRALLERYEQLLCDWENLSYRSLEALSGRPLPNRKNGDALRRS